MHCIFKEHLKYVISITKKGIVQQ